MRADGKSLDFDRDLLGQLMAGLFGLMLGVHWLFSYSYSRGYDLSLWVYNGWLLKNTLFEGAIPNWSSFAASGQPFFKISGLSDGILVAVAMRIFGDFMGVQVVMCALYIVAAVGFFKLARGIIGCQYSALAACGAYVLSWFMTFTANFQAYISNFFIYALIPWFVFFALQSLLHFSLKSVCWAAVTLALSILANPQVAIKMAIIAAIVAMPFAPSAGVGKTARAVGAIFLFALALSAFDIISAVRLRQEVMTINSRQNAYISPFALIAMPAYGFSLAWEILAGVRWPTLSLHELLYAKYPGLIVVALGVFSLRQAEGNEAVARWLMAVTIVSYCVFFVIMPHIPAAPWIGISHNLLIIPTFCLALLAGLGFSSLRSWLHLRWGEKGVSTARIAVLGAGFMELYVLFIGVRMYGAVREAPIDLPEAQMWRALVPLAEKEPFSPRFFSLNPDHSTSFFPVVTGLPTANVVDLRQRLPEYQSYLDLIKHCVRLGTCPTPMSALLAPLNVGYVDVPLKFFTYKGTIVEPGEYEEFAVGLNPFERDAHLERVLSRSIDAADRRPQATALDWSPRGKEEGILEDGLLAQSIFRNTKRVPAQVAERAFAIVGEGVAAEKVFEQIVLLPEYEPGRFVFILTESLETIGPRARNALDGYLVVKHENIPDNIDPLTIEQVRGQYMMPRKSLPKIASFTAQGEQLHVKLAEPLQTDRFIFVSQQFFRDWHAVEEVEGPVSLFKVGGGLTGAFVKAGTGALEISYRLPPSERGGRWFSLLVWISMIAVPVASNPTVTSCVVSHYNKMR